MKKLVDKLRAKRKPQEPAGRITTDTLAEHREKVLAGGRKFKYPVQYQRHKLVINALIIGVAALTLLIASGWYLLYQAQNTSEFMYRVTKVVPVPVAVVDGQQVRYSEYLMKYRSAVHYLVEKEQVDINSEDGKKQLEFIKHEAMNDAIGDAYSMKLAKEYDVEVTEAELETFLKQERQSADGEIAAATYNATILDYYGWTQDEYRELMKTKLLRQKVAYAIDANAEKVAKSIEDSIKSGTTDLTAIATQVNGDGEEDVVVYGPAEWVPKSNQDGGLAAAAAKLEKGQVSVAQKPTSGMRGYYYVKLIDINETDVNYEYIYVPLKELTTQLDKLEKDSQLTYFIKVDDIKTQQ